ncbi:Heterogeneous nuclear ribonucleoprotein 1 [Apostasia shenzhenica]|uniref:Heterogeneous nuclear ribonucleoprotein 1 n=1 Tax=Apostasia shenzhenica TaxID=1088818 RepID=A0A2I0BBE3_9ASPA|nr:Heterogeneous nuclear ribonucleoprotein 1 [Apostasia shenzhenica]
MDFDEGKLFIGGISWETTEDKLHNYFGKYGQVLQTVVMRDKATGKPRGFGFVVFADPTIVDRVLLDSHSIDGRTVEAKKAMSREEQHAAVRSGSNNIARNAGGVGGKIRTKKIFVGGLPSTLSEMEFRQYFEAYGTVTDVVVMYDQNTQRPRGFGFVSFDSEDCVDRVVERQFHDLDGKSVEVKRALPKDANPSSMTNRSVGGGSYQSYGGSSGNTNSYDSRIDSSRYMQPPGGGPGYSPYGTSGYGTAAYGYGTATNAAVYGGYGGYGTPGTYGNPSAPGAAPPGASRGPWNTQVPALGSAGYAANSGYGGAGAPASGQTGHSPVTAAGYANQGYGYGGYGMANDPYGNQGGYGVPGGRVSGTGAAGEQVNKGSSFVSGGYGDGSTSVGYSNTWWTDPAQGAGYGVGQIGGSPAGTNGYSGVYGGSQPRQAQQQ